MPRPPGRLRHGNGRGPAKGNAEIGYFTAGCSLARLYVGDAKALGTQSVYSFELDGNNDLTKETQVTAEPSFSVAMSPDGKELFSGQATADQIQRFEPRGLTRSQCGRAPRSPATARRPTCAPAHPRRRGHDTGP